MRTRGSWAAGAERRRLLSGDMDGFRQRQSRFRRRFAADFGYEIRDPFDEICAMLAGGETFSYSRFGDGEFKAILGVEGMNCDGHRFFPDLGRRLAGILERHPDYLLGLLPLAVRVHGMEPIRARSAGIRWVLANSFSLALLEGRLGLLLDALADREVLLVGPAHLQRLAEVKGWAFLEVPSRDCWTAYAEVGRRLRESVPSKDGVALLCASMMSNVLIDDMHRCAPGNAYVDTGSVFDPLCGVNSRLYHEALDPYLLRQLDGEA